jgi:hypothetical protein
VTEAIHLRPGADLAAWLGSRRERIVPPLSGHLHARAELELWRAVIAAELRHLPPLTLPQASCIADALAGPQMQSAVAQGLGLVYAQVFDAFRLARSRAGGDVSSFGAKHGVKEQEILDYLEGLSPAADHALADAISRWWQEDLDATAEGFAAAGLRVTETA